MCLGVRIVAKNIYKILTTRVCVRVKCWRCFNNHSCLSIVKRVCVNIADCKDKQILNTMKSKTKESNPEFFVKEKKNKPKKRRENSSLPICAQESEQKRTPADKERKVLLQFVARELTKKPFLSLSVHLQFFSFLCTFADNLLT